MTNQLIEPDRDPNPFHHAARLVQKMDRFDLDALTVVIADRREQLGPRKLKWVSLDGGGAIANGKRGVYRLMRFLDGDIHRYCLTLTPNDAKGTHHHIRSDASRDLLKTIAEDYEPH
jgi:hypothetical protein